MHYFAHAHRLLLLVVGGLVIAAVGCQRGSNRLGNGAEPLRWGADEEGGAPYISKEDDTYVGFEVDLKDALAKELGKPIEFKQYQFEELVRGLKRGDIDFAMNGLEITDDRKALIRFSRPYYIYRLQLVTRADDKRFNSLKDLEGKKDVKVGTLINTAASRLLDKLGIEKVPFTEQVNPYKKLAAKDLDAVLLDLPIAIYVVKKNEELNKQLKFTGEPIEPGDYAIAFRKEDEALAQQFDKALERLIQNGELKRILEKWELWNDEQKQLEAGLKGPKAGEPLSAAPGK